MQEIERKFLVKELPDLSGKNPISYERYFLKILPDYEERIQKKGNKYELERKFKKSDLTRTTEKEEISKEQFEELKKQASKSIIRESYLISKNPEISIKIYHGDFEGLKRIEVEFSSEEEAKYFQIPDWFDKEITGTFLGNDSKLIKLNKEEFKEVLADIQ